MNPAIKLTVIVGILLTCLLTVACTQAGQQIATGAATAGASPVDPGNTTAMTPLPQDNTNNAQAHSNAGDIIGSNLTEPPDPADTGSLSAAPPTGQPISQQQSSADMSAGGASWYDQTNTDNSSTSDTSMSDTGGGLDVTKPLNTTTTSDIYNPYNSTSDGLNLAKPANVPAPVDQYGYGSGGLDIAKPANVTASGGSGVGGSY